LTKDVGTIGLFEWDAPGSNSCAEWDSDLLGQSLTTARASITLAIIFAFIAGFLVLFEMIFLRICCSRLVESTAFFLAQAFTWLVYVVYGSTYCTTGDCDMGSGAYYNMVAGILYFIASLLMCCTPKPEPLIRGCCKKKGDSKAADEDADRTKAADEDV
jgi:hypothetical protein